MTNDNQLEVNLYELSAKSLKKISQNSGMTYGKNSKFFFSNM